MPLKQPPASFLKLNKLISEYNLVSQDDPIQRIFYLQKIDKEFNKTKLNQDLLEWCYDSTPEGWQTHLISHGIHPDGSFFLKNIQFAQAAAKYLPTPNEDLTGISEFPLLQQRNLLLEQEDFTKIRTEFSRLCSKLNQLSQENTHTAHSVKRQLEILEGAKSFFARVRGKKISTRPDVFYKIEDLNKSNNNYIFKFNMSGPYESEDFIFRIEDRNTSNLEQHLYSYPVSKLFVEDLAYFRWGFIEPDQSVVFRPVVLCKYAKQGNLVDVAKSLRNTDPKHFPGRISNYFTQLTKLCDELLEAEIYHPDIKLSNLLMDGSRVLISDRKTLVGGGTHKVSQISSTPVYAPQEYVDCITAQGTLTAAAYSTEIDLPQFMAYQLGMALKEFLLLTQDEINYDEFREHTHNAREYFAKPDHCIVNLFALINELTREDAKKRMSIKQMQSLLNYRAQPTALFYKKIEEILPAKNIGIQKEVDEINALINAKLTLQDLNKVNKIFTELSENDSPEPRLLYLAEQLAAKCFKEVSYNHFKNLSQSIEKSLLEQDLTIAPWYRKIAHILSFGYLRVAKKTTVESININVDFKDNDFQLHFAQLEYIDHAEFKFLGKEAGSNFENYILYNLAKIRINNEIPQEKIKRPRPQAEGSSGSVDEDADLGTAVQHSTHSAIQEEKSSPNSSPTEQTKDKSESNTGKNSNSFFANKNKKEENKRLLFRTYRTTMFQSTNSIGHKTRPTKRPVNEIFSEVAIIPEKDIIPEQIITPEETIPNTPPTAARLH